MGIRNDMWLKGRYWYTFIYIYIVFFTKQGTVYVFGTWQTRCKSRAGCEKVHSRRSICALEGSCLKTSNGRFAGLSPFSVLVCKRHFVKHVKTGAALSMSRGHQMAKSGSGTPCTCVCVRVCLMGVFLGVSHPPCAHFHFAHEILCSMRAVYIMHFDFSRPQHVKLLSPARDANFDFAPCNLLQIAVAYARSY